MTRSRTCGTKQRHPTKDDATAHYWALVKAGTNKGAMQVYRCPYCGAWHVGHRKRARR